MEENKKSVLDRVLLLAQQDSEFYEELRKKLGITSAANPAVIEDERLNQIYEYCIEKILRKQAENFYEPLMGFPEQSLLVEDFINMEHERHRDRFDYYSLGLYEQIERILNAIFDDKDFLQALNRIWDITVSINIDKEKKTTTYTFGNEIWGTDKNKNEMYLTDGKKRAKSKATLSARDKLQIVIFFFKYYSDSKYDPYKFYYYQEYKNICNDYLSIYACRNTVHRGTTPSEKDKAILREKSQKSSSYFEFNWLLTQFVWLTKDYQKTIEVILAKLPKRTKAIVTQIYGSAAFVKIKEDTKAIRIPDFLFTKIKGHKANDSIDVMTIDGTIVDIC